MSITLKRWLLLRPMSHSSQFYKPNGGYLNSRLCDMFLTLSGTFVTAKWHVLRLGKEMNVCRRTGQLRKKLITRVREQCWGEHLDVRWIKCQVAGEIYTLYGTELETEVSTADRPPTTVAVTLLVINQTADNWVRTPLLYTLLLDPVLLFCTGHQH
jgi:hypothetical protein